MFLDPSNEVDDQKSMSWEGIWEVFEVDEGWKHVDSIE